MKRTSTQWCALALSTVLLSSCASYKVYRIKDATKDNTKNDTQEGVRFYRPAPYFLIGLATDTIKAAPTPAAAGGAKLKTTLPTTTKETLTIKLIYLPDKSENYAVRKRGGFGTTEATLSLQDGWNLVAYGSKADSKIPETITAVASLVSSVAGLAKGVDKNGTPTAFPSPGLWRLEFKDGQVSGVQRVPVVTAP